MPHCQHEWEPLVKVDPAVMGGGVGIAISFALALKRLDSYERCRLCGRISYLSNSRARRRKLVSADTERLETRAKEFQEWVDKQKAS